MRMIRVFRSIGRQVLRSCGFQLRALRAAAAAALVAFAADAAHATIVRFQFSIPGLGVRTIDVRLYDTAMPRTVANFLKYVDDNDWDGSVIHRRSALADSGVNVVQGGGFIIPADGLLKTINGQLHWNFQQVPTDPAIADEPGGGLIGPSNLAGTIAMAKSGPNTATSQWYFNSTDNTNLDGDFSAFGRILLSGMNVLNDIVAMPRYNIASPFNTLPVQSIATIDSQQNVFPKDVVIVQDVRRLPVIDGDYNRDNVVNNADLALWRADFGSRLKAEADGNGNGVVDAADFLIWQRNYGRTPAVSSVPEPGAVTLAFLVLGAAGARRRWTARRR